MLEWAHVPIAEEAVMESDVGSSIVFAIMGEVAQPSAATCRDLLELGAQVLVVLA